VVGVSRTLLALGSLGTLLFSHSSSMFRPVVGLPTPPYCQGSSALSLYCLVPAGNLELARWTAVIVLIIVASGWRPDVTGLLHWWVAFSLPASTVMVDGGDLVTNNLALLLLPITLTDNRTWHWEPKRQGDGPRVLSRFFALSAAWAIRVQLAVIYLHAFMGKVGVEEWVDGTALYYWLLDPMFGVPAYLVPLVRPFLLNGVTVALATWSVLLLELLLFAGLFMEQRHRRSLLVAGLALHGAIGAFQGLVSFALAMWAALILYLWPLDREFGVTRLPSWFRGMIRKRQVRLGPRSPAV
jgi:antimicrobial peptide system SdpB family protein